MKKEKPKMSAGYRKKTLKRNLESYSFLLPNLIFIYTLFHLSGDLDIKICVLSIWRNRNGRPKVGRDWDKP